MKKQLRVPKRSNHPRPRGADDADEQLSSDSPLDLDALDEKVGLERPYVAGSLRKGAEKRLVGTDAELVGDLWRAHHKYITRIKIDKAGVRETVLADVLQTGMKFRNALQRYELAVEGYQIALPPEVPEGLNAQWVDGLVASFRKALKETDNKAQWRIVTRGLGLGKEKGSALEYFLGSLLPPIFERYYQRKVELRRSDGHADTAFIRFAITVCGQLGVVGRSGRPPKRETIVKACSLYRKDVSRRKVSQPAMGN